MADPEITVQVPVPEDGIFPLKVTVGLQLKVLDPALAVVGAELMLSEYSSISPDA